MSKCKKHLLILSILEFLRHIFLQKIFLYKKMVYTDYISLRDCDNATIDKGIECDVYMIIYQLTGIDFNVHG